MDPVRGQFRRLGARGMGTGQKKNPQRSLRSESHLVFSQVRGPASRPKSPGLFQHFPCTLLRLTADELEAEDGDWAEAS